MKQSRYSEYAQYSDPPRRRDRFRSDPSTKEPLWPTLLGLILGLGLILALAFLWYFPMLKHRSQTNGESGIEGQSTYLVNAGINDSPDFVTDFSGGSFCVRQGG